MKPEPLIYATLPERVEWAENIMRREPDFTIGPLDNPYMRRWFVVPRNEFSNLYLHEILRSDDDRALHDHPWPSRSFIIDGGYFEHLPGNVREWRAPGWVGTRTAENRTGSRCPRAVGPCRCSLPALKSASGGSTARTVGGIGKTLPAGRTAR